MTYVMILSDVSLNYPSSIHLSPLSPLGSADSRTQFGLRNTHKRHVPLTNHILVVSSITLLLLSFQNLHAWLVSQIFQSSTFELSIEIVLSPNGMQSQNISSQRPKMMARLFARPRMWQKRRKKRERAPRAGKTVASNMIHLRNRC